MDLSSYDLTDVRAMLSRIIDQFMEAAADKSHGGEAALAAAQLAEHAIGSYLALLNETQTQVEIARIRSDLADLRREIRGNRPWD